MAQAHYVLWERRFGVGAIRINIYNVDNNGKARLDLNVMRRTAPGGKAKCNLVSPYPTCHLQVFLDVGKPNGSPRVSQPPTQPTGKSPQDGVQGILERFMRYEQLSMAPCLKCDGVVVPTRYSFRSHDSYVPLLYYCSLFGRVKALVGDTRECS